MHQFYKFLFIFSFIFSIHGQENQSEEIPEEQAENTFGLFASPISFSSLNDEKTLNYGLTYARDYKKHETRFFYERDAFSSTDPLTLINVRSSEHSGIFAHDINQFWGDFTYFLLFTYERKSEGGIQIIEHEARGGLIGIKYDLFKGEKLKTLSLSYIPFYEYLDELAETEDSTLVNTLYQRVLTRNIRHSLRLKIKYYPTQKLSIKNTTFYRPATSLDTKKTDFDDIDFENSLSLSYEMDEYFSITYRNIYTWDIRRKRVYRIPSSDMEQKITIDFSLTL